MSAHNYRWQCQACGMATTPPVALIARQSPPTEAVARPCPICQDLTPHRADNAPERHRVPRLKGWMT